MKSRIKILLFNLILVILPRLSVGQESATVDTLNLTFGKWTVCTEMKLSSDYKCTNGWTNYSFEENGNFVENQGAIKWYGKYKLNGTNLTLKRNDEKNVMYGENTYTIIWLDKNKFYSIGQEGPNGPKVYTCFERIN